MTREFAKVFLGVLLTVMAYHVQAQPRPDLSPAQASDLRDQRPYEYQRPHWCRYFGYGDYTREMADCRSDRACRQHVRSKASRCGLR